MKIIKSIGIVSILFFTLCTGNAQEITPEIMNKLIEERFKYIHNYSTRPVYSLQISKQGCRVVVETEARDYRFVANNGSSMMFPLNYMIMKSGEQQIKIKVYPLGGEEHINKHARVQVNIFFAPDKESRLSEYEKIDSFTLPNDLEPRKMTYYEGLITFVAEVPYNYRTILDKSKDLREVVDLREQVEKKYKEIWAISKSNDFEGYVREHLFVFGKVSNTTYQTLEDLKANYADGNPYGMVAPAFYDKEFLPLDDCELQFYAEGKVVALWHRGTLKSGLDMKYKYKQEDGTIYEGTNADPLFLYMPEGSSELKAW